MALSTLREAPGTVEPPECQSTNGFPINLTNSALNQVVRSPGKHASLSRWSVTGSFQFDLHRWHITSRTAMDSSIDKSFPTVHSPNVISTAPMNSLGSSQMSSQEFNSESISAYVDGLPASSDQQIWTVMDLHGPSGNTPKVPGSRPGRPTN
jgi:hypothetical protein